MLLPAVLGIVVASVVTTVVGGFVVVGLVVGICIPSGRFCATTNTSQKTKYLHEISYIINPAICILCKQFHKLLCLMDIISINIIINSSTELYHIQ